MGPSFIVIGAMKCGTSTVCAWLEDHPEVHMVAGGEPNFFSHDDRFARGQAWYEAEYFANARGRPAGEGSNAYSNTALYPETPARIAALYPETRIVYMVRHPVDRIGSAWLQNRQNGGDAFPPTLDRAVRERAGLYVGASLYWQNLSRYRAHFPDEQIFLGFLEDLNADNVAFFARLADFLGIGRMDEVQRPHQNPSSGKRIVSPLYSRANSLPLMGAAKRVLPSGLKRLVKERVLSRPVTGRPALSAAVAREVVPQIRQDAERLLTHAGRPRDFWTFDA